MRSPTRSSRSKPRWPWFLPPCVCRTRSLSVSGSGRARPGRARARAVEIRLNGLAESGPPRHVIAVVHRPRCAGCRSARRSVRPESPCPRPGARSSVRACSSPHSIIAPAGPPVDSPARKAMAGAQRRRARCEAAPGPPGLAARDVHAEPPAMSDRSRGRSCSCLTPYRVLFEVVVKGCGGFSLMWVSVRWSWWPGWRVVGWGWAREWLVRRAGARGVSRPRWSQSRSPVALPGPSRWPLSGSLGVG